MTQLEKRREAKLARLVTKLGGICLKLETNFRSGLPDRLILLPGSLIYFVEVKRDNKKLRPLQVYWQKILSRKGFKSRELKSDEDFEKLKKEIENDLRTIPFPG